MPSLTVAWAAVSSLRSQASSSGTSSPMSSLPRSCRLGRPSSVKMRSMSLSACFISPIDSSYSFLASLSKPQCLSMRWCRKYWLVAVSSFLSCALSSSMTLASPFMVSSLGGGSNGTLWTRGGQMPRVVPTSQQVGSGILLRFTRNHPPVWRNHADQACTRVHECSQSVLSLSRPCPGHVPLHAGCEQGAKVSQARTTNGERTRAARPAPSSSGPRRRHGLSWHFDRRRRSHGRRGGVQHLHHRLSGNPHRPQLLPSDRDPHVSAHRQLRRQR